MTTVVTRSMGPASYATSTVMFTGLASTSYTADRSATARRSHLLRRVRVDLEGDLDVVVAVADVAVDPEDPADVHLAFEF